MEYLQPPKFNPDDGNIAQCWRDYKAEFDNFLMASGKSKAGGEQKIALLLYGMGREYIKISENFVYEEGKTSKKNFDDVKANFDQHFEPKKLVKLYVTKFQSRKQKEGETISEFINELKELARHCEFGDLKDRQIAIQISNGVKDNTLKDKLWSEDLELTNIIQKCQMHEQRIANRNIFDESSVSVHAVGSRGRSRNRRGRPRPSRPFRGASQDYGRQAPGGRQYGNQGRPTSGRGQHGSSQGGGFHGPSRGGGHRGSSQGDFGRPTHGARGNNECDRCKKRHAPKNCPAYGKRCNFCNLYNHFEICCRKKKQINLIKTEHDYGQNDYDDEYDNVYDGYEYDDVYVDDYEYDNEHNCETRNTCIFAQNQKCSNHNVWCVDLCTLAGNLIHFKIDTAADATVITKKVADNLNLKVERSDTVINGYIPGGGQMKAVGCTWVTLINRPKGIEKVVKAEVVNEDVVCILGESDCRALKLVKRVMCNDTVEYDCKSRSRLNVDHDKKVEYDCKSKSRLNVNHDKKVPVSTQEIYNSYSDVQQGIGKIPGKISLTVDPNVSPVANPPRPVPAALRDATLRKLQEMEDSGVIEKIPLGTVTPWVSSMHVVPKKNTSEVRITIDPQHLNKALQREYHPITTIEDVITRTSGSKLFTVIDANQGYFQLELDEKSSHLVVFNTPFGRYRYKRLPMGISSAPEIYQRAMNELFSDIEGVEIVMDDILIHGPTIDVHDQRLKKVLQRCRDINLKINPKKTKLCVKEVEYIGHKLTDQGVKVSDEKVRAILEMPEPENISQVQTLLGMVNYTMKFMPNLSAVTEPLRQLIKQGSDANFYFDEVHRQSFTKLKKMMTTAPVLKYYSMTEPITVTCDASQSGLGCAILQGGRPVAYASKALTDTEYAYAQIEKELLAICFAFRKFHTFLYGRSDITVETDHLPLVRIFQKELHQVPLRLQKMRMGLQQYDFELIAKRGKDIPLADALSRAYLPTVEPDLQNETQVFLTEVPSVTAFKSSTLEEVKKETAKDPCLQKLMATVHNGWPENKQEVDSEVAPYWDFRDTITHTEGLLVYGQRVIIPYKMRKGILAILHESHQGMVRTKQLARDLIFWPGLRGQIKDMVSKCSICQQHRNYQQKETMIPSEVPTRPWSLLAMDLFDCKGTKFLIMVDYYSEFFEIRKLSKGSNATKVIKKIKKIWSVHGIPDKVLTDNGPPFSSRQMKAFAEEYRFELDSMSPWHSQTNGMVERAVQTCKRLLSKCLEDGKDVYLALLDLRNTPRGDKEGSPAQRLMGRRTKTKLPTADVLLRPQLKNPEEVRKCLEDRRETARKYYNRGAKDLPNIHAGDTLRVRKQKQWIPAELVSQATQPRSYNVRVPTGRVVRRNRRDLLVTSEKDIYHRETVYEDPEMEMTRARQQHAAPSQSHVFTPTRPTRKTPPKSYVGPQRNRNPLPNAMSNTRMTRSRSRLLGRYSDE
jgi:hypothetical protein